MIPGGSQEERVLHPSYSYIQQHPLTGLYWAPACCRLCPAPFVSLTAMTRTLLLAGRGEAYPLGSLEGKKVTFV